MIPRKLNTIYSVVAAEIGISEDQTTDIVVFFWKEIKKEMEEPAHLIIQVPCFGTFEIRRKQVQYMIDKYKRIIKGMKLTNYSRHAMVDSMTKKIERLEKILIKCEEQDLKKKQVREIQKNGKTV